MRHSSPQRHNVLDHPGSQHQHLDRAALAPRIRHLAQTLDHAHRLLTRCAGQGAPGDQRNALLCSAAAACASAVIHLRLPLLHLGVHKPGRNTVLFLSYAVICVALRFRRGLQLTLATRALQAVFAAHAAALQGSLPQVLRQLLDAQSATLAAHHAALCRLLDADGAAHALANRHQA